MTFEWPIAFVGLLLVPALAAAYVAAQQRRRRFRLSYSSVALVQAAAGRGPWRRRHVPAALFLLAIAAMVVALARPQASLATPEASGTIILVIDSSGSMRSTDIKPSRIDAAEAAVREFVNNQPKGVKVGVVAFAGSAFLIAPPTDDRRRVINAVNLLQLQRGTNIGDGLLVALDTILDPNDTEAGFTTTAPGATPTPVPQADHPDAAAIILLSDGASTVGPDPLQVADQLAQAGIRTYTVGLGVSSGSAAPGLGGGFGGGNMLPDLATLQGIADRTGGKYFSAQNADQLHKIYGDLSRQLQLVSQKTEVTFVAAGASFLLLIASGVLGMLWSTRLP